MRYILAVFIFFNVFNAKAQSYLDYYFKANNIEGAIVIFDENKNEWLFNTETEPFYNTPAAAHFHLWQTLVGLEDNIFKIDLNQKIKWSGVKRSFFDEKRTEWNKDTNLADALKYKNDWYFDTLQQKLSEDNYKKYIKNTTFFTDIKNNDWEYFWNYAAFTNPNTMILFLKDLYESKLPFNIKNQQFLLNQLLFDQKLVLHNSTTHFNGKNIDWSVGIYLKHDKPIYFSLRTYTSLEIERPEDYEKRKNLILAQIFDVLGY